MLSVTGVPGDGRFCSWWPIQAFCWLEWDGEAKHAMKMSHFVPVGFF
jgi:hypothetical protein